MSRKAVALLLVTAAVAAALHLNACGNAAGLMGAAGTGPGGGGAPPFNHRSFFSATPYEGTATCLLCHQEQADDLLETGHWKWQGTSTNITGLESEVHGKIDLLNNFCIAVPSNEGRCTQCHIGIGWMDKTFDFTDPEGLDCLICHDQTGTYRKAPKTAGAPEESVDLQVVAQSVGDSDGQPNRSNCGLCHYFAGGGDNVKHGDLCSTLNNTTRAFDVHMGTDGGNFRCQRCHGVVDHGIGGMPLHSVHEGAMRTCTTCHGEDPHPATSAGSWLAPAHPRLACQVCHIPAIARARKTKVEWYWADAGQNQTPVIDDDGRPDYDKMKGSFVWEGNVRPTLLFSDGKWDRMVVNVSDTYAQTPVVLAKPSAAPGAPGAKIHPFKKMIGNQVADPLNMRIMVPHLFGLKGGPNPYWAKYDWDLALQDGSAYTGQPYSGTFAFVDTVMYLSVNHEVAPKEMTLGSKGCCADCHGGGQIEWALLGRPGDPYPNPVPCGN